MAYDEVLAERIRDRLTDVPDVSSKRMFGGLAFMVNGNMAVGAYQDGLLVRLGEDAGAALAEPHVRPFGMGKRTARGFVLVDAGVLDDATLDRWVRRGLDFALTLPTG